MSKPAAIYFVRENLCDRLDIKLYDTKIQDPESRFFVHLNI
jgi:hypothetical protein